MTAQTLEEPKRKPFLSLVQRPTAPAYRQHWHQCRRGRQVECAQAWLFQTPRMELDSNSYQGETLKVRAVELTSSSTGDAAMLTELLK